MPEIRNTKRALVLGCGGVAGAAWSIAVLNELQRQLHWDPRTADIFVGTSAGAVLAALLSAGVSADQLLACQQGTSGQCRWNHDQDTGGALPPLPGLGFSGLPLVLKGLQGKLAPFTAALGLLPRGQANMASFMRLVDSVVPAGEWTPHADTRIMVVDAASGERVALGRDVTGIPLNRAVCASYAVPGWCPPVDWQGHTYLDGGIASPVSADQILGANIDEAVVLAPMASSEPDRPASPLARIERRVRRYMTAIVDREINALERAGVRVIRLEPRARDLAAFGFNMMDPRRREHVLETALSTAPETVTRALQPVQLPRINPALAAS